MGLVIGLNEGEHFYVNDTKVTLEKISSPTKFTLSVPTSFASEKYTVTDRGRVEIMPRLFCSAGFGTSEQIRVNLEGPRDYLLLRAELYEKGKDVQN